MLPEGKFYKQGKAIITKLLKEGVISDRTYWATVGNEEIGEEVLQKNVFSHHFLADDFTFQSTPMQRFCEESTLWEAQIKFFKPALSLCTLYLKIHAEIAGLTLW